MVHRTFTVVLAAGSGKHVSALRVAGCFLSVIVATIFVGLAPEENLIWVANGVLLAYLLLAPRKRWPFYLCAGYAAQCIGGLLVGHHGVASALLLTFLNVCESLVSASLLRRRSTRLPDFTNPAYVARFLAFGVFLGPIIMGAAATVLSPLWHRSAPGTEFLEWVASDALGACVATPACVAIFRTRFRNSLYSMKHWGHLVPVVACAVAVFSQSRLPLTFLLYPLLVLVMLRLGLGWAAMASLFVAAVGSSFTVRGQGPFAVSISTTPLQSAILLQLFIASAMAILYNVSVVIESLRVTERRLQEIAALHNLVTENSRDIILLADFNGRPRYISPAVFELTGWRPNETMERAFSDVAHPDDLPKVEALVGRLREGTEAEMIEYRIRRRSGGYIWVEGSFRIILDSRTGVRSGILQVIRNINDRKRAEQAREFQSSVMRAIHEVTLDGILVVDNQKNIASLNKRFSEIWQIATADSTSGAVGKLSDQELMSRCINRTRDPEAFVERVHELYADPDANDSCEVELKGGRTLERYTTGLRSECGQDLGRVWFFRDITDRKFAEKQLQDAYSAVELLAITDALTGLANRRQFDQCLATEWRRGIRNQSQLSLLLVDVDLFKSYNDRYGHLRGDSCLKQIAEAAQCVVTRTGDLISRFGGEEFAVILPDTPNDGAIEVANAICESLRARKLPHEDNPFGSVTVSVGCATATPQLGQNSASLVELADQALYKAKRSGRNRVCASAPEVCPKDKLKSISVGSSSTHKAS